MRMRRKPIRHLVVTDRVAGVVDWLAGALWTGELSVGGTFAVVAGRAVEAGLGVKVGARAGRFAAHRRRWQADSAGWRRCS